MLFIVSSERLHDRPMNIFVTGGTGFLGTHIIEELLRQGFTVSYSTRGKAVGAELSAATPMFGELEALTATDLKCFDAVIHSAAVTPGSSQESDYDDVNNEGTRRLVDICSKAGVTRFVHISTMAVEAERDDAYVMSKRKAEQHVQASAMDWIIIRPGAVYGVNEWWISYLSLMEKKWLIPVIGDGEHLLHQIYVKDCARVVVGMVPKVDGLRKIYYAAAEPITYNRYLSVLRSSLHAQFRKIHIAMWMGQVYAAGMKYILRSPKPHYTYDPRRDLSLGAAISIASDSRTFDQGLADMLVEMKLQKRNLNFVRKD